MRTKKGKYPCWQSDEINISTERVQEISIIEYKYVVASFDVNIENRVVNSRHYWNENVRNAKYNLVYYTINAIEIKFTYLIAHTYSKFMQFISAFV